MSYTVCLSSTEEFSEGIPLLLPNQNRRKMDVEACKRWCSDVNRNIGPAGPLFSFLLLLLLLLLLLFLSLPPKNCKRSPLKDLDIMFQT